MLAPDLTVAENIFIDKLSAGKLTINWRKLKSDAKKQLEKLGFGEIDPGVRVGTLSVAYQQVVEICKCLTRNARCHYGMCNRRSKPGGRKRICNKDCSGSLGIGAHWKYYESYGGSVLSTGYY